MQNSLGKYTYPFFETIRVLDGMVQLLDFHQRRVDHVFRYFFPMHQTIELIELLPDFSNHRQGVVKFRFEYNATSFNYRIQPYTTRSIEKLVLKEANINYPFKFSDRGALDDLTSAIAADEDILLVNHGRIRETSYANIILKFDEVWLTPMYPIFHGVMRAYLLESGAVKPTDLFVDDLLRCDQIKLINAMMPMESAITLEVGDIIGLKWI